MTPAERAEVDELRTSLLRLIGQLDRTEEDTAAKLREIQDRARRAELLEQHHAGILIALYNGLNALGVLVLEAQRINMELTVSALQKRQPAEGLAEALETNMRVFSLSLAEVHERLRDMNDQPS